MPGDQSNRPKREAKEVKLSNRKIVSQKDLDEAHKKPQQSQSAPASGSQSGQQSSGMGKAAGGMSLVIIVVIVAFFLFSGKELPLSELASLATTTGTESTSGSGTGSITLNPESNNINIDDVKLTPAKKRPYTVLVYMNGTDLESKYGCATTDLGEMANSGFDSEEVNLLILTGGTQRWKNNAISDSTSIYHLEGNNLKKLADLGKVSMADTEVLKKYVDFGVKNFPADRFGFVFWNHGGGTIYGYGSDQNFNGAHMSVSDIETAFRKSEMVRNKFEFIGFDCCLMGTIELAYLLEPYADYMIASEETEPGNGWDYKWLKTLSDNPSWTGAQIGKEIVDTFIDFYEREGRKQQGTLSVVDLSKAENLSRQFESFMQKAGDYVENGGFNTISKARKGTKSFGYTGQDRSSFDLVDIKHLAQNLEGQLRTESAALIKALEESVVYYKNTSNVSNAFGLSTYVPYAAKEKAAPSVQKYSEIGIMPNFGGFLADFTQNLTGKRVERKFIEREKPSIEPASSEVSIKLDPKEFEEINQITFVIWRQLEPDSDYFIKLGLDTNVEIASDGKVKTAFDGYWATLGGQTACLYEVERSEKYQKYSTPALLNGQDVSIIVMFDKANPDGKVLGAIPASPMGDKMASKYLEEIKPGDKLALKYFAQLFLENEVDYAKYTEAEKWVIGNEFTVNGELTSEIVPVDDELYLYGFWIEDTQGNNYYTDFIEIRF